MTIEEIRDLMATTGTIALRMTAVCHGDDHEGDEHLTPIGASALLDDIYFNKAGKLRVTVVIPIEGSDDLSIVNIFGEDDPEPLFPFELKA